MADTGTDLDDEPPFPAMAPAGVEELTEEQQDSQNRLNQEGLDAFDDGKLELAEEKFTAAIAVGAPSALLYSRRAQVLLQLGRPRATENDCTAALSINPDSAKAYKIRARARTRLGHWEDAHADFQTALKIDYDEQTDEDSRDVAAKVKEIHAAATRERVKEEEAEHARKMKANKEAYEKGLLARSSASVSGKVVLSSMEAYAKAIQDNAHVVILFTATW